jgi:hypothetical protein
VSARTVRRDQILETRLMHGRDMQQSGSASLVKLIVAL